MGVIILLSGTTLTMAGFICSVIFTGKRFTRLVLGYGRVISSQALRRRNNAFTVTFTGLILVCLALVLINTLPE